MSEYIVEKKQTSGGWTWAEPKVELIRCRDCFYWLREDGMFKDIDEKQWHHCPHLGIDTDEYFYCREGKRRITEPRSSGQPDGGT